MDQNRDDVLNDLIKYYDGDDTPQTQQDDDMGATRVVSAQKSAPVDEEFGKTVVVNVKKKSAPKPVRTQPQAAHPEKTDAQTKTAEAQPITNEDDEDDIKVYTPTARVLPPIHIPESAPAAGSPVDEVLGNLDLSGLPLAEPAVMPTEAKPIEPERVNIPKDEPAYETDANREEAMKKRRGIWYSLKPLWVTILCCLVAAAGIKFYITTDGVIGIYKRNFNYNMGLIFNMLGLEWNPPSYSLPTIGAAASKAALLSDNDAVEITVGGESYTEEDNVRQEEDSAYLSAEESYIIPFDEAGSSEISVFNGGVVCAKSNYMCFVDQNGNIVWETDTAISDPILSISGKYIAIASSSGTQLSLYKKNKLVYNIEAPNNIRSCNVSSRGDVVLITDKASYKGAVVLINSKGETVFSWSSGVNYITAANVLRNRRIVVSLVSAAERVTSYVMMFDINSTDPLAGTELRESLVYALDTNGKLVYVNGDNCVSCMSSGGNIKYDLRYDEVNLTHSANDKKGDRLITYTQDNTPIMNLYNKHGALAASLLIEGEPDFIDVYKTTVLYNNGRDIICGEADDEKKVLYTASRTIRSLKLIDSGSAAAVYADGIEIIKF